MNNNTASNNQQNRDAAQTPVEDYIENVAMNHLEAIGALFTAITQLGDDHLTAQRLACHGMYVAQMLSNELDNLCSRMEDERAATSATAGDADPLPPNVTPLH